MLIGRPKSEILDFKHYCKIRKLARANHLKIYELMHEIVDQHFDRMDRLEALNEMGSGKEIVKI